MSRLFLLFSKNRSKSLLAFRRLPNPCTAEDIDSAYSYNGNKNSINSRIKRRRGTIAISYGITGSVLLIIFRSLISLCFITCLIRISFNLKKDQNRPHDP